MSRCLSAQSIDHVVLERGEVANSWKEERWDSLHLLTPNWQADLPGFRYDGDDPDGYLSMPETIGFIERYADLVSAPLEENTTVTRVQKTGDVFRLETNQGNYQCRTLVLASGACNLPNIPPLAEGLNAGIQQVSPLKYRSPDELPDGGVVVVGASATGVQIARELQNSGRQVTLCVGEHVRLPRTYRGRDIQYWMDSVGVLDERYDEVDDIVRARNVSSPQLVGTEEHLTLDLNRLVSDGVRLRGRLAGLNDGKFQFSGSLKNKCNLADLKMNRLLGEIDEWIQEQDFRDDVEPAHRFDDTVVEESPPLLLDLEKNDVRSVVWATGFHPDYSWLDIPVLDRKGKVRHDGGVAEVPGLYLLGLTFLRRRKSSFIHGTEDDVNDLAEHLTGFLAS